MSYLKDTKQEVSAGIRAILTSIGMALQGQLD